MIKIAICDDENFMLNMLYEKISSFFNHQNIKVNISSFSCGKDLLNSNNNLDIIFLDIKMDKLDGFETAKKLRDKGYKGLLIFVTVLKDYVFDAFEVQAFDYLTKPLKEDNFIKTMNRALKAIQNKNEEQLLIQKNKDINIIPFENIVYCEIINRKVYLHLKDSLVIDYYDKIENLEKKLDNRFYKCHRSYLINLQYLKSYKSGLAYLTNGDLVPVSRLRKDEFSAFIIKYMKQRRNEK